LDSKLLPFTRNRLARKNPVCHTLALLRRRASRTLSRLLEFPSSDPKLLKLADSLFKKFLQGPFDSAVVAEQSLEPILFWNSFPAVVFCFASSSGLANT
jgi:hypothetical protein